MSSVPPFVRTLLFINVIVFLLQGLLGPVLIYWFALWPGSLANLAFTPWTLVSYSFLHGGLMHLAFNMFALWMFGSDLERVWGSRRLALAWFVGVVAGALAQLVVGAGFDATRAPIVGASAGVFAVLLAYALVFPNRTVVLLIPPIPLPARVFVALYAAVELYMGVTGTQSGVAHFAHLGGLLGGWVAWRYGGGLSPWRRW
jgi:membrane associated rhomboid family serine protease